MVAVHNVPSAAVDAADPAVWTERLGRPYSPDDRARIGRALERALPMLAGRIDADGVDRRELALGTAAQVEALRLDADCVVASLLLDVLPVPADDEASAPAQFGSGAVALVNGVRRMSQIDAARLTQSGDDAATQAEALRKMLLAMVEDIRVVLVKLAERLQMLRLLTARGGSAPRELALATRDIFAPLANRLGVWQLKWELEDLALRILEPATYKEIAHLLDERRLDRQTYIEAVKDELKGALAAAGVKAEVSGRPKHIFSIYSKLRRKDAHIDEIYDIRAVRILVAEVKDCYAALGVVHHIWTPLAKEFDDYIAKPKANNYRSLHTAVIGPGGKPLEVQIRTFEMHQHSEYGVAAHWRYKEGAGRRDPGFDEKIAWLRQVLDWKDEIADTREMLQQFKTSLFTDTIYVLTPQGKVIDLPVGSTPVDFAYAVHTSLGHRCRGAKVDGAMVPLNHVLANGQRVDITAAKQGGPSRDWLNPDLGFVQSHRARAKVRQWFKAQQVDQTTAQGRAIVERELAREGMTSLNLDACAAQAGFARLEDFFLAAARGEVNTRQIQTAIRQAARPVDAEAAPVDAEPVMRASRADKGGGGILIVGVDKLLTGLARCCRPVPPDPIVGFVTRGKGISVHRAACSNAVRMRTTQPERLIDAAWGAPGDEVFPVDVEIEAVDRQGLLRDISEVFARERINVTAVNTQTRNLAARMFFTVEIRDAAQLERTLALVREVKGVLAAARH